MAYRATRPMKMGDHTVQPGETVPGAEGWKNLQAYLRVGHLEYVPDAPVPMTEVGGAGASPPSPTLTATVEEEPGPRRPGRPRKDRSE